MRRRGVAFLKKSLAKNFLKRIYCVAILCISNFDLSNGLILQNGRKRTKRFSPRAFPCQGRGTALAVDE